jgi:hypothetical protein
VKSRWPAWIGTCALAVAGAAHAGPTADRDPGNHYILDCPDGCPQKALEAAIGKPSGIAVDDEGNVYFTSQHMAFKLRGDGTLLRIAGTGARGYGGDDGPATGARLNLPESVFDNGDWCGCRLPEALPSMAWATSSSRTPATAVCVASIATERSRR